MKRDVGRPTVMTQDTLNKLEEVFALGGTDKEACFYAGISHQTLYDYQKDHPEFVERKEALKETPILKARRTVVGSLDNSKDAQWYLERKKKDEFSERLEVKEGPDFEFDDYKHLDKLVGKVGELPTETKGS